MIVAIGGGEIAKNETYEIDKFIVASAQKEKPNFLFVPTASNDAESYVHTINALYESLGCRTDTLYLCHNDVDIDAVNAKIERADIIYVGGGNTAYMMEVWKKYCVDTALLRAYNSGKILSGLSAGSICWFIAGHSDSEFIDEIENPKHKWVKGLGIIPYLHCPHYDEPERAGFDAFYSGQITDAIAIENQVAVVWANGEFHLIKSNPTKNAYRMSWSDSGLSKAVL